MSDYGDDGDSHGHSSRERRSSFNEDSGSNHSHRCKLMINL